MGIKKLFTFFQVQALFVPLLASTFFVACHNQSEISIFDFIAVLVAAISVIGEAIADKQLLNFKQSSQSTTDTKNLVCNVGLWKYSRHPNYFFEWLYWLSFPLFSVGDSYFYFSLFSPVFMYYLIRYVTGIPPAEDRMLRRKGEVFKEYQLKVSPFFPLPPKN